MQEELVVVEKVFLSNKKIMSYTEDQLAKDLENQEYKFGFVTNIESDQAP